MSNRLLQRAASLSSHVTSLRKRHRKLDSEIMQEHTRPAPDHAKLRWLKARRLVLRDQLRHYESLLKNVKPLAGHALARKGGLA
ncbi:YdcH family protein [Shimia sp. SDUM112013]|uniref:YdcH family protein n=1 Tax=Shimia sp. SDUM112013 TaxID=3136160 RepID=UPI0032EB4F30